MDVQADGDLSGKVVLSNHVIGIDQVGFTGRRRNAIITDGGCFGVIFFWGLATHDVTP